MFVIAVLSILFRIPQIAMQWLGWENVYHSLLRLNHVRFRAGKYLVLAASPFSLARVRHSLMGAVEPNVRVWVAILVLIPNEKFILVLFLLNSPSSNKH